MGIQAILTDLGPCKYAEQSSQDTKLISILIKLKRRKNAMKKTNERGVESVDVKKGEGNSSSVEKFFFELT